MAMALIDAGLPTSRFSMDAIDISLRALEQARKGVYSRNSFRGTETDFRNRYFKADGQEYRLTEAVRSQVRFRQGNLIDAGLLQSTEAYDMIYCRNLLIYFDADTQKRAVQALTRLLAPHGYLFLGPSETSLPPREDFVPVKIPLAFVFQKVDAAAEAEEKGSRQPAGRAVTAMPADFRKKSRVSTSLRTHMPVRKETTAPQSNLPGFSLDEARRLADAGSLEEATRLCEEHLRDSGPSAQAWFLLGLIRDAAGDGAEAMTAYRKALYLDPNHDEALIHLALLLEKRKEAGGAKLLYERARRITQQSRQP
jgi:chemotaxis protein methyltransferase WspC